MLIKPFLRHIALTTIFLMLAAQAVQAEPATEAGSPYRLNIAPAPISSVLSSQPSYALEYKYRPQSKPALPAFNSTAANATSEKLARQPYSKEIALAAKAASLDPALVHAVIYVESRYRHDVISSKGAVGLMQVLPDTAARYGINDVGDSPRVNLKAGTLYLRDLMRMFGNRTDLALAAYNAGEGAVQKYSGQVPPYRETREYVLAVMTKYNEWRNARTPNLTPNNDNGINPDLLPAKRFRVEYLVGTRLALSDQVNSPKY